MRAWLKAHGSAAQIGLAAFLGLLFLGIGVAVDRATEEGALKWLAFVLLNLSAIAITAAVVTVFLSLADVRESLVAVGAQLFGKGEIVRHLSAATRAELGRRLVAQALEQSGASLDESLYQHTTDLQHKILADVHAHNYSCTVHRTRVGDTETYDEVTHVSFRLSADHLLGRRAKLPLRLTFSLPVMASQPMEDPITSIEIIVGAKRWTKDALERLDEKSEGAVIAVGYRFSQEIEIERAVDVTYTVRARRSVRDCSDYIYARYPTYGFTVSVTHDTASHFEYAWFTHWDRLRDDFPNSGKYQLSDKVAMLTSNTWLLPGDGVAISWASKT